MFYTRLHNFSSETISLIALLKSRIHKDLNIICSASRTMQLTWNIQECIRILWKQDNGV